MDARSRTQQLAKEYIEQGDPLNWFEQLYATAKGDPNAIPWAHLTPNLNLVNWLDQQKLSGEGKTALVIGCGLGDDAEEMARRGFQVTAFDISPTAIEWCQNRFSNSRVHYCVADLFETPESWQGKFEFVLESYTIQAMPPEVRAQAIPKIAAFVAPVGTLLVICRGRNSDEPLGMVPFPLSKDELARFPQVGLREIAFEDFADPVNPAARRFRVQYAR